MEKIKKQFIISNSAVLLVSLLGYLGSNSSLKELIFPLLIFSVFVNLILSYIIYYLNGIGWGILSFFLFIVILRLMCVIKINYDEYTNYENWQYYNHKQIISSKVDLIIAKNLLGVQYFSFMICLNLLASFIMQVVRFLKKKLEKNEK
ncbi:hypothetical protein Flavo103_39760 [Flavobacterium collinsii]|uniref:hypothetical protein n=1 Tax=Flavobacterium collinsii TaxID=1114861 RepID=UPI0022C3FD46|nr:hypothetical protein [Flavobacterium collinsii]GIQ60840.1 hypothetical protein Flavo103_39760 [Flavobacterium collinsii]